MFQSLPKGAWSKHTECFRTSYTARAPDEAKSAQNCPTARTETHGDGSTSRPFPGPEPGKCKHTLLVLWAQIERPSFELSPCRVLLQVLRRAPALCNSCLANKTYMHPTKGLSLFRRTVKFEPSVYCVHILCMQNPGSTTIFGIDVGAKVFK